MLWLWPWLAGTAPIRPLAWDPPCAAGAALEKGKKTKKKVKEKEKKKRKRNEPLAGGGRGNGRNYGQKVLSPVIRSTGLGVQSRASW